MEKELLTLQKEIEEVNNLKETVPKVTAENKMMKKNLWQLNRKLNLTRKTSELKMAEMRIVITS